MVARSASVEFETDRDVTDRDARAQVRGLIVDSLSRLLRWSHQPLHERVVEESGIQFDASIMPVLDLVARQGPTRVSDIAHAVYLDPSTVSRRVSSLIQMGYAKKITDVDDRRAAKVSLTPEGARVRQVLADAWRTVALSLIDSWEEGEQDEFCRLLQKIVYTLR